jgi:hypothetical protein
MKGRVIGPFTFADAIITGDVYLGMLEQFVYPQAADFQPNIIDQQ